MMPVHILWTRKLRREDVSDRAAVAVTWRREHESITADPKTLTTTSAWRAMTRSPHDQSTEENRVVEPRPDPDTDDIHARGERGSSPSSARWVRVLGIVIAAALIALVVVLHLTGTLGAGAHQ
jgi:hypothetical protein